MYIAQQTYIPYTKNTYIYIDNYDHVFMYLCVLMARHARGMMMPFDPVNVGLGAGGR